MQKGDIVKNVSDISWARIAWVPPAAAWHWALAQAATTVIYEDESLRDLFKRTCTASGGLTVDPQSRTSTLLTKVHLYPENTYWPEGLGIVMDVGILGTTLLMHGKEGFWPYRLIEANPLRLDLKE